MSQKVCICLCFPHTTSHPLSITCQETVPTKNCGQNACGRRSIENMGHPNFGFHKQI